MKQVPATSAVNHPAHYNAHPSGVECIDIVEHMNFCLGNAVKYVVRCPFKGSPIQDLEKALWYTNHELTSRQQGRLVHLPRICDGYYPGSEKVDRFLSAEPSMFMKTVVRALWDAHRAPHSFRELQIAAEALYLEIDCRQKERVDG